MRTGVRLGVCPSPAWWRVLAVTVAVALAMAFFGVSCGSASATVAPNRGLQLRAHAAAGLGLAPAGLRAAVSKTLGRPDARTCLQAELTAADGAEGDELGVSVAISGSTAVVGAPDRNSDTGAVYVFVRSGKTWTQQAELTAANAAADEGFGASVAISRSTVVVSAEWELNNGAVYVFARSGKTWSQQAELTAAAAGGDFGVSVAISGSTVMVGALGIEKEFTRGAVYVFVRSGKTWSQQAKLTAPHGSTNDSFGYSVAISGSTVVVSAPGGAHNRGAVYAFVRSGKTWSQQAELTAVGAAADDDFGQSVAISGSRVAVGAVFTSSPTGTPNVGAAYVFVRSGKTWSQQAKLTPPDGTDLDNFGNSVAISGSTVMVGAPWKAYFSGAVYVFVRSGKTWSQRAELAAPDGDINDQFGWSMAISGSTALVGAIGTNSDTGAVYVYKNA